MLDCQADAAAQKEGGVTSKEGKPKRKLIGFSEQMRIAEEKKAQQVGPDSWAVRKFAVGLVIAIYGYSYYVLVVRLCVKMVRLEDDRRGGRAQGIAYLVVYHLLFLLFVWSYVKAITTPPGFARDYVPKTDPPPEEVELVQVEGYRFENMPARAQEDSLTANGLTRRRTLTRELMEAEEDGEEGRAAEERRAKEEVGVEDDFAESHPTAGAFGPAVANLAATVMPSSRPSPADDAISATQSASGTTVVSSPDVFPITYPPKSQVKRTSSPVAQRSSQESAVPSYLNFPQPPEDYEARRPKTLADRIPPKIPVLTEDYRYDSREGLLRPYRSHRCKHCAAVVLKMDHHCPWVGTCVGARNYKYFYNFLQYSTLYTLFVFVTLLVATASPSYSNLGTDGQQVAIIAIAGVFVLFTGSLLTAHTRMMLLNVTTIEDIGMNRMRSRERSALARVHGFWGLRAQRRTKQEWDRQWGRIGREGNLWWLGSSRANWEMVMGKAKLGWFLPLQARPTPDDGLSYVPNPRFSREGYWQERKDWPVDLQ